jgi:hypothetical protein
MKQFRRTITAILLLCLDVHVHEQPLLTRNLVLLGEVVEGGELETDPPKIFGQSLGYSSFGMTIDADDKAGATEVRNIAQLEKRH